MNTTPLPDIDLATLRAWAEAGVISTARYVEEAELRRKEHEAAELAAIGVILPDQPGDLFHHPV